MAEVVSEEVVVEETIGEAVREVVGEEAEEEEAIVDTPRVAGGEARQRVAPSLSPAASAKGEECAMRASACSQLGFEAHHLAALMHACIGRENWPERLD
ncbi:MAG: hypothetical protein SGPRY_013480, partial [Prymnesium sp.]